MKHEAIDFSRSKKLQLGKNQSKPSLNSRKKRMYESNKSKSWIAAMLLYFHVDHHNNWGVSLLQASPAPIIVNTENLESLPTVSVLPQHFNLFRCAGNTSIWWEKEPKRNSRNVTTKYVRCDVYLAAFTHFCELLLLFGLLQPDY